jgi:hypothetical protein
MFKFRLLAVLPLLTLILPVGAAFYVTRGSVEDAKDDLEKHLKHVAVFHLEGARKLLMERESRTTLALASEISKGSPFVRPASNDSKKNGKQQAGERQGLEAGDPELVKKLAAATGGSPKNFAAVFDSGLRLLGESPVDPNLVKACSQTMTLGGALGGKEGSALVLANDWVYMVSAAPVTVDGSTAAALCFARRVDDSVARDLKKLIDEDITLTVASRLIGTSIRDSYPRLLPDIILKKPGTTYHGEFSGRKAPFLVPVPLLMSSDVPATIPAANGEISVTLTAPMEPEIRDLRTEQLLWFLFSLLAFLLSLGVSISVYVTARRSVTAFKSCMESMGSGNLQAQVSTQKLSQPFKELGDSINHAIFSIRERGVLFHQKKRQELDEVLGREENSAVWERPEETPASAPPAEHAVATDLTREQEEAVDRALEEVQSAIFSGREHGRRSVPADKEVPGGHVSLPNIQMPSTPPLKSVPPHAPPAEEAPEPPAFEAPDLPPTMAVQVSPQLLRSLVDEEALDGVFREFLELRKQCGERVDTVPRDRFLEKLKKTRADVIARTACREVRFTVFAKDGKASVKAVPVK